MYNPSYQPSFAQQQQVPSQYRGLQRTFQPTGNVPSFYQRPQPTAFAGNVPAQNYHLPHYTGNLPDNDAIRREDSTQPSSYAVSRGQFGGIQAGIQTGQYGGIQGTAVPTGNLTRGFVPSGHIGGIQQNEQALGNIQGTAYHTANYVGNQQGHDEYRFDRNQPAQAVAPTSYHMANYAGNPQFGAARPIGTIGAGAPVGQFAPAQSFSPYRGI